MNKSVSAFGMALIVLCLVVATALGFLMGITHPFPWVTLALLIGVIVIYNKHEKSLYLKWKPEYSVGIDVIDNDHKKLINLINQFQTASLHSTGDQFERDALNELVDYTVFHFQREEEMLQKNNYPDFDAHKKEHEAMVTKVKTMVEVFNQDKDKVIDDLLDYLKKWLINHINGTDQAYSEFMKDKDV
jgi:hemerythrin-like metal-binding protein